MRQDSLSSISYQQLGTQAFCPGGVPAGTARCPLRLYHTAPHHEPLTTILQGVLTALIPEPPAATGAPPQPTLSLSSSPLARRHSSSQAPTISDHSTPSPSRLSTSSPQVPRQSIPNLPCHLSPPTQTLLRFQLNWVTHFIPHYYSRSSLCQKCPSCYLPPSAPQLCLHPFHLGNVCGVPVMCQMPRRREQQPEERALTFWLYPLLEKEGSEQINQHHPCKFW